MLDPRRRRHFRKLSIPRDTLANIPGQAENKINSAYATGGAKLTVRTVEEFLGINVDQVAIIDFDGFRKFIDTIGGRRRRPARPTSARVSRMFVNSRLYCVRELALEVVQGQLHGRVLVAGQEVERVGEVVEDGHRLHHDHRHDDRLQQREDDLEEQPQRPGAVDDRRLVELPRDRRDEGAEQQDR